MTRFETAAAEAVEAAEAAKVAAVKAEKAAGPAMDSLKATQFDGDWDSAIRSAQEAFDLARAAHDASQAMHSHVHNFLEKASRHLSMVKGCADYAEHNAAETSD